jgi:hypothetical protein
LAGASLICGCSGSSSITGSNDFPVLAFSDRHFNSLYNRNPDLISQLVAADASQWASIFETFTITTPSAAAVILFWLS